MPHLVQMDKKLRKKGLVIIAAEVQGSSKDKIKNVIENANAEFTVTEGVNGPINVRGIPTALIFDTAGKMIFNGHPSDDSFDRIVKKALKDVKIEEDTPKKARKSNKPIIAQRAWKNKEGKSITASVTKIEDEQVTFKLRNLKVMKYDISKLSEPDQEMIKNAMEESAEELAEE